METLLRAGYIKLFLYLPQYLIKRLAYSVEAKQIFPDQTSC